ncbi:hypothetical protein ACJJTC_000676 [Scirpophaga incertulas]
MFSVLVLAQLIAPNEPKNTPYNVLKETLQEHYDPTPLEIAEYYKFHHRKQMEGESIRDYLAALRKLAATCNFGAFLNTALRNQFTCGLLDHKVQDKLLESRALTLDRAVEIALSSEARRMELEVNTSG